MDSTDFDKPGLGLALFPFSLISAPAGASLEGFALPGFQNFFSFIHSVHSTGRATHLSTHIYSHQDVFAGHVEAIEPSLDLTHSGGTGRSTTLLVRLQGG